MVVVTNLEHVMGYAELNFSSIERVWLSNKGNLFRKVWSSFIILWTIWKELNECIFNNLASILSQLEELVLLQLSWWIELVGLNTNIYSTRALNPPWLEIPPNSWKWNVDASCGPIESNFVIGGVLRDTKGEFIFFILFTNSIRRY